MPGLDIHLEPKEAHDMYLYLEDSDIEYWNIPGLANIQDKLSEYYRSMEWWDYVE